MTQVGRALSNQHLDRADKFFGIEDDLSKPDAIHSMLKLPKCRLGLCSEDEPELMDALEQAGATVSIGQFDKIILRECVVPLNSAPEELLYLLATTRAWSDIRIMIHDDMYDLPYLFSLKDRLCGDVLHIVLDCVVGEGQSRRLFSKFTLPKPKQGKWGKLRDYY